MSLHRGQVLLLSLLAGKMDGEISLSDYRIIDEIILLS